MFTTEILADPSQPRDAHGNLMILTSELVQNPDVAPQIGVTLTINTGHPADDEHEAELDTELYFQMPFDKATSFAEGLKAMMDSYQAEQNQLLKQALEFKSAQLACAKGEVGTITITKIADSDRGNVTGFAFFSLEYFDDTIDNTLLHSVQNIECYVPFLQEEQYEWLRTLVGGNHQHTSTIKVNLVGFTLEEIRQQFEQSLRERVEAA